MRWARAVAFLGIGLGLLHGCASSKPKSDSVDTGPIAGPVEVLGPDPSTEVGPQPEFQRPLVLVLGPGMVHAFAHAGVLKALNEAKIPIGAIWGSEMGGLVGAVYAKSKSIHEFEWSLLQIKDECFWKDREKRNACLKGGLDRALGGVAWHELRTPLRLGLRVLPSGQFAAADRGDLVSAILAGFSFRDYWTDVAWESREVQSAADFRPYPVDDAKLMNLGPVVVVQVLGAKGSKALPQEEQARTLEVEYSPMYALARRRAAVELERADFVLEVDLNDLSHFDFKKKTSAMYRGRVAVQKNLALIRALLGKT